MHANKGDKESWCYPTVNPENYKANLIVKMYYWCNSGMAIMVVTIVRLSAQVTIHFR